jgi:hypothetical protein
MFKKILFGILLLQLSSNLTFAQEYTGLDILNGKNWAKYFDELSGYVYDSHGCLHFSPTDIYLLYKTIPDGTPLRIMNYALKQNEEPTFAIEKVPFLIDKINSEQDLEREAAMFKYYKSRLLVYPSLNLLFIFVNDYPYARVKTLPGIAQNYLLAMEVQKNQEITWDIMLSTPTDPGEYTILSTTDHYLSSTYYQNTLVPFGAWIKEVNGSWFYEKDQKWHKLPERIKTDLARAASSRLYNYYDLNYDSDGRVVAARYAGGDFGKYALVWTQDGRNRYPELGYAAGELLYEQIILIKDLVHILTTAPLDDFDSALQNNENFSFYKSLYEFKISKGAKNNIDKADPAALSYYKLFNGFEVTKDDSAVMDPRAVKAFWENKQNRLPRDSLSRQKSLGLYHYLRINTEVIDKMAGWYEKVKNDWELFKNLGLALRNDFEQMGVLSLSNRQNILSQWFFERMEFKKAVPPRSAKYVQELSFTSFFKPDEDSTLFTERERAVMLQKISQTASLESLGLKLQTVDALNHYNFGILLNEILGELYKSHGCMHVSPRNITLLYDLLPIGAQLKVHPYLKKISPEAQEQIPNLAGLVNFKEDFNKLKEKFAVTSEVKAEVYPYSGDWIIYLKNRPFASLLIRGGPQAKFYLVQGRDQGGYPIFQEQLSYPTTPGEYRIFKKVINYVSTIYADLTAVGMGETIKKENNKWVYRSKSGETKLVPEVIAKDLNRDPQNWENSYYDILKDEKGRMIEVKWGSHPFGKYALMTSSDGKNPWPELIHSSGDLILEERQIVNDLIKILTAPQDELDQCLKYSEDFETFKLCYDYINDPIRTDLIQAKERAAYKIYYNIPLGSEEARALPPDVIIAYKVLRKAGLSSADKEILIKEGIAKQGRSKLSIDMEKILGLQYDSYQYVVTIRKFAHHYQTLKNHWEELNSLRRALLVDFNNFVIKDINLYYNFMRELMLKRKNLERISQEDALQTIKKMLSRQR